MSMTVFSSESGKLFATSPPNTRLHLTLLRVRLNPTVRRLIHHTCAKTIAVCSCAIRQDMTDRLYSTAILGYNLRISLEEAMTTKSVEIYEAQQHLAELVAQVATGTEIILLDGQTPRARLVPITSQAGQRVPGLHAGSMSMHPDFDQPLPDEFWVGTP